MIINLINTITKTNNQLEINLISTIIKINNYQAINLISIIMKIIKQMIDNFNKKSNQNRPRSGSKFYQLNSQNIQLNRQANDSKLTKKIIFTSKDILNYINNDE